MAWMVSLKIVLISSGVLALALAMKLSFPLAMEFIASHAQLICTSFWSLLRPPYIYVLINGIIITIAATSRFHGDRSPQPKLQPEESESNLSEAAPQPLAYEQRAPEEAVDVEPPFVYEQRAQNEAIDVVHEVHVDTATMIDGSVELAEPEAEVEDDREDEDKVVVPKATWTPPKSVMKSDGIAWPVEKPLVSTRFSHRKPARPSPEGGKPLRVAKPRRQETLETTWKAITEGRPMPLSRHMKKSETMWGNHGRQLTNVDSAVDTSAILKTETFQDRTNQQQQLTAVPAATSATSGGGVGGGKLRKEPSLSQEELNRRVEAFINKFNEEMRLERQQSLNQYMEMINRGSQ